MKRTISLWLGLVAFAMVPVLAQTPAAAPTGKIHGHVTNPSGATQASGSVSLSSDGGHTSKYTFPVNASGDFTGEAAPGTYMVIFRQADTPPDKMVDSIENVKVVAGQDMSQDVDMSRQEFIDKLPPEAKKQAEEMKKHNSEALKVNAVIKGLNADLKVAVQDIKDADGARAAAVQQLGAGAAKRGVGDRAAIRPAVKRHVCGPASRNGCKRSSPRTSRTTSGCVKCCWPKAIPWTRGRRCFTCSTALSRKRRWSR